MIKVPLKHENLPTLIFTKKETIHVATQYKLKRLGAGGGGGAI